MAVDVLVIQVKTTCHYPKTGCATNTGSKKSLSRDEKQHRSPCSIISLTLTQTKLFVNFVDNLISYTVKDHIHNSRPSLCVL